MPLGIAYLGAVLEQAGFEVTLIDAVAAGPPVRVSTDRYLFGLDPNQLARAIANSHPDLVGISCPFTTRYGLFRQCLAALRQQLPKVPLLTGGIHPTLFYQSILQQDHAHVVVLGEGEHTLLELVSRAADKGKLDPEGLDGVAWQHNDRIQVSPRRDYIDNLDDLPQPARHLLPMDVYLSRSGGRWASQRSRVLSILTSRSCPGRCSFCGIHAVFGTKWRAHSSERILQELEEVIEKYQPTLIAFEDDRLTWDRDRLLAICHGIRSRNINVKWHTPNGIHVEDLDEELLRAMKLAGCKSLNLAVESGDPYILQQVIGKKATAEQALHIAHTCQKIGIRINGYFVIGMPGETEETLQRSLDLCLELPLDGLGVFIATPFPGTRMFDHCVKQGYIQPEHVIGELSEAGDPALLHTPLFDTETMSRQRLLWWEQEFNRRFLKQLYRRRPAVRLKHIARSALNRLRM
jgi:anaerobic magnesium-protoporphyrin IX monomethyl ester cyclase